MTVLGRSVLPDVALGSVPFWRQYLRGFSQCAFQANEVTGLIFVIAVATYNWRMAVFYVLSVLIATLIARLLKADRTLTDLGLFGFNSGLMGLAMGNFYEPNTALWVWVGVLAVVAALIAIAMGKWLPIPFLAAPFILTFWAMWFIADARPELVKLNLGPWPDQNYTVEFEGTQRPAPLSASNTSTFLTTYLPDLFLVAAMLHLCAYQKNWSALGDDPNSAATWEAQYLKLKTSADAEELRKRYSNTTLGLPPGLNKGSGAPEAQK